MITFVGLIAGLYILHSCVQSRATYLDLQPSKGRRRLFFSSFVLKCSLLLRESNSIIDDAICCMKIKSVNYLYKGFKKDMNSKNKVS